MQDKYALGDFTCPGKPVMRSLPCAWRAAGARTLSATATAPGSPRRLWKRATRFIPPFALSASTTPLPSASGCPAADLPGLPAGGGRGGNRGDSAAGGVLYGAVCPERNPRGLGADAGVGPHRQRGGAAGELALCPGQRKGDGLRSPAELYRQLPVLPGMGKKSTCTTIPPTTGRASICAS